MNPHGQGGTGRPCRRRAPEQRHELAPPHVEHELSRRPVPARRTRVPAVTSGRIENTIPVVSEAQLCLSSTRSLMVCPRRGQRLRHTQPATERTGRSLGSAWAAGGDAVIGLLDSRSPEAVAGRVYAFRQGKESGYVEGQNIAIEGSGG